MHRPLVSHERRPRRAEHRRASRVEHLVKSNPTAGVDPAPTTPVHCGLYLDKTVRLPHHDTDRIKHALLVGRARQMDDDPQPRTQLTMCGFAGQPRGRAQGLDPGRHIDH